MPVSTLAKEERDFLAGQREAAVKTEDAAPSDSASAGEASIFKDLLEGKLVALDGKRVSRFEMDSDPEYYAFYFSAHWCHSAHWCQPCRTFTPKLVEFYNNNDAAGKKFEIIFMSSDRDERSMEDYTKEDQMPWPAVKYRCAKKIKEIRRYAGRGIPCLVLARTSHEFATATCCALIWLRYPWISLGQCVVTQPCGKSCVCLARSTLAAFRYENS